MKIAQVAPLFESVPPAGYGGTERVVSYLTDTLVELGHDVTLYASADSRTRARLVPVLDRSLRLNERRPDPLLWHVMLIDRLWDEAAQYDVIHFHTDIVHLPIARRCGAAAITTLHGRLDLPDLGTLYRHFGDVPLVSVSASQRAPIPWAHWLATVHHGVPADLYAFHPEPGEYFAFLGRIAPEKRVDRAIEIALACETPLRIAAKVDTADQAYFAQHIQPRLAHPLIRFVGEIDDAAKNDFLGRALALLMPIDWPEPFGLVVIEAFACGTPVLAYGHGSIPEIVDHGCTGFIVNDQEQAIAAARQIARLDRSRCRAVFERRFTASTMARAYLGVYRGLSAAKNSDAQ